MRCRSRIEQERRSIHMKARRVHLTLYRFGRCTSKRDLSARADDRRSRPRGGCGDRIAHYLVRFGILISIYLSFIKTYISISNFRFFFFHPTAVLVDIEGVTRKIR